MAEPECDLVLRGGVTSGVVYPGALVELSRRYRFRAIGGASAGAIAAGVAAAAQYGVGNGVPDAFSRIVAEIPEEVAGGRAHADGTSFRRLFQAAPGLEPLSGLLWAVLGRGVRDGLSTWLWQEVGRRLGGPWLGVALALAGLFLIVPWALARGFAGAGPGLAGVLLLVLAFATAALAVFGAFAVVLGAAGWRWLRGLPGQLKANGFGLCTGVAPALWEGGPPTPADVLTQGALVDWIHLKIQQAAGLPLDRPLTMGDLWRGGPQSDAAAPGAQAWRPDRAIDLVLTTTNLSHQVPHRFPFLEKPGLRLYFQADELVQVLPRPVVAAMVQAAQRTAERHRADGRADVAASATIRLHGRTWYRLPHPEDLPVLLGVRLSLSFPLLLSAVRLYAWRHDDRTGLGERDPDGRPHLRPCLFSDGGITSNFPISVFDTPLPGRPTFGINLAGLRRDAPTPNPPEADRIDFAAVDAAHVADRTAPEWRVDPDGLSLPGFLTAIVDTARNAHENELVTAPTARGRVVTIRLDEANEGGLNLDMDASTVLFLDELGRRAGRALVDAYAPGPHGEAAAAWAAHRHLRLRATLAALEDHLSALAAGWTSPAPWGPRYKELLVQVVADLGFDGPRAYATRRRGRRLASLARRLAHAARRPDDTLFDGRRNAQDPGSLNRSGQGPRPRMALALRPTGAQDPLRP
ncbi:MAG: patatin-like phospholipase family protein [Sphingomonadaceae bacterium]|uniref:patatin-like phospholipase family protein n=1 Tax=Thermaurantiacus sp. TaxID=2820283 RepID=UPI00298F2AF9|nr:patatin-like phospholipase family protein [Thermaurantiacus sp.]MCS6986342.1 patatin-like phospholipase family protein [Sphingomonadaceae bacterium]MDW8414396.1 patatin-like phospholipase family protein [Thermaurantiacus sp.]